MCSIEKRKQSEIDKSHQDKQKDGQFDRKADMQGDSKQHEARKQEAEEKEETSWYETENGRGGRQNRNSGVARVTRLGDKAQNLKDLQRSKKNGVPLLGVVSRRNY